MTSLAQLQPETSPGGLPRSRLGGVENRCRNDVGIRHAERVRAPWRARQPDQAPVRREHEAGQFRRDVRVGRRAGVVMAVQGSARRPQQGRPPSRPGRRSWATIRRAPRRRARRRHRRVLPRARGDATPSHGNGACPGPAVHSRTKASKSRVHLTLRPGPGLMPLMARGAQVLTPSLWTRTTSTS